MVLLLLQMQVLLVKLLVLLITSVQQLVHLTVIAMISTQVITYPVIPVLYMVSNMITVKIAEVEDLEEVIAATQTHDDMIKCLKEKMTKCMFYSFLKQ